MLPNQWTYKTWYFSVAVFVTPSRRGFIRLENAVNSLIHTPTMYVIVLRTKGVSDLLKMNVRSWRLFGAISTSTLTFRLKCLISRNNPAGAYWPLSMMQWWKGGESIKKFHSCGQVCANWLFFAPLQTDTARLFAAICFQPTVFFFSCRPIQHDSLRPFGSNRQYFCSPVDRYFTTRCGHLVPNDSCDHCFPVGCVLICLHADTARSTVVSVFQPAVFWPACRPILRGLVQPVCSVRLYYG